MGHWAVFSVRRKYVQIMDLLTINTEMATIITTAIIIIITAIIIIITEFYCAFSGCWALC